MTTYPERHDQQGFVVDRRRSPERRSEWRGGRRDSDWRERPPGAWEQLFETEPREPRWRTILGAFHLW